VSQPISLTYRMPPCGDDVGEPREPEECEQPNAGYSHACRARLEPFASWPASSGLYGRPAAVSSAESMLDLERITHSCTAGVTGGATGGAGSSVRCDCVRYASPYDPET
jgi:hypothetical protein